MVLHLHKSESSEPAGPEYAYPAGRGGTVNAAKETIRQCS